MNDSIKLTRWIPVDYGTFNRPFQSKEPGQRLTMIVAPQNVPEAVRGCLDRVKELFIVEFLYYGSHVDITENVLEGGVTATTDDYGRIHEIRIPLRLLGEHVRQRLLSMSSVEEDVDKADRIVERAIDSVGDKAKARPLNVSPEYFNLSKNVVRAKKKDLFQFA